MLFGLGAQKKSNKAELGIIDIHTHILPGLDDGSKSLEESLRMARIAYDQGIRAMIATPHLMPEGRRAGREEILEALRQLQEALLDEGLDIDLYPGNEIYFHEEAIGLLEQGEALTLAGSDCVLVEFSPMEDARYIRNALREVMTLGLTPVVAHVERYANLMKQAPEQIGALKGMGALVQVNAATVEGKYGKGSQKQMLGLLKRGLVDFLGTDAHSASRRAPRMEGCLQAIGRRCPQEYIERLARGNAERYLLAKG